MGSRSTLGAPLSGGWVAASSPGGLGAGWDFCDLQDLQDFGVLRARWFRVVFVAVAIYAARRGGVRRF